MNRNDTMKNIAREIYGSDLRDNQKHFLNFYRLHQNQNIIAEMPDRVR